MNNRPTPETDAIRFYLKTRTTYDLTDFEIWQNHSAKLERERDEAREALRTIAEHGEKEIQKLIKECDEARNKMADALQEVDLRTLDCERMKQERDEAKELAQAFHNDQVTLLLERDEAREDATNYYAKIGELEHELNNMQDQRDFAMRVIARLEQERDEARQRAAKLAAQLLTEMEGAK